MAREKPMRQVATRGVAAGEMLMGIHPRDRGRWAWLFSIGASLLLLLILWPGDWVQGREPAPGAARPEPLDQQPHIAVHQGQLSVDLQDAAVGEVLAQIAHQAGITILAGLSAEKRVSIQCADIALEAGLRRLLRV
jgi:hypothetical protein